VNRLGSELAEVRLNKHINLGNNK